MWIEEEILIDGKKLKGLVNVDPNGLDIELPYNAKLCSQLLAGESVGVSLKEKNYEIKSVQDVGDRKETLFIYCTIKGDKNERKSNKSREDIKV
tara:strand:- start:7049 stop:7330 length:282 start_codon:yes stop_codon:yes gene_type:complete